jgi:MFS family permease
LLISLVSLLNHVDRRLLISIAPLVQAEWALSDTQLGLVMTLYTLARTLISLPAGWLADRIGKLAVIRFASLAWALLAGLSGLASRYGGFLALRLGSGLADGANGPADIAFVSDLYPPAKHGRALALYNLSVYLGSGLGLAAGGLIGERFGWRWAFLLVGALGGLGAAALFALRRPLLQGLPARQEGGKALGAAPASLSLSGVLRWPLPGIFLGGSLGVFAATGLVFWLPTWMVRQLGYGVAQAGATVGVLIIAGGMVGNLTGGLLSDRWFQSLNRPPLRDRRLLTKGGHGASRTGSPRLWTAVLGLGAAAALGLIGLFSPIEPVRLVCICAAAACLSVPTTPVIALVEELAPVEWRATAIAVFGLCTQVAGAAPGVLAVGALSDLAGLHAALLLPLGAALLGGAVLALVSMPFKRWNV